MKYRESIREEDPRGIRSFMEAHEPGFGLVVTQEQLELHDDLLYLPLWLYLLMA
ncbi:MAG: hypothetical protein ACE5HJ_07495 [Thermoplasmata archaeon]